MTIALPPLFKPTTFLLRLQASQRTFASPFGGSEQTLDMLQDRWLASLALPPCTFANAAQIEAFLNAMRGQTQVCYLHHFGRPVPRGTMRGTPYVTVFYQGADNLTVQASAGDTLLAGDMIGVGGYLLQVRADCAANGTGVIVVPVVNRLRETMAAGPAVIWDRPTAPFRMVSPVGVQFVPGYTEGVSLDFVEAIDL